MCDMFSSFKTISMCDGQTDRQAEGTAGPVSHCISLHVLYADVYIVVVIPYLFNSDVNVINFRTKLMVEIC